MSFADELRKAPENKQQREKEQLENDWNKIENMFTDYIKKVCKCVAELGENKCVITLESCVGYIEEEYTSQYSEGWDSEKIVEIEFDDSNEGIAWMHMRNKFFYYICEEKSSLPYPDMMGMSKKDAEDFSNKIKKCLVKEGLKVESFIKKDYYKVHYVSKYIKHTSKLEQILTGTDGHYEEKEVMDEEMYRFYLDISW